MSVADVVLPARRKLTEEELALLRHPDLVEDGRDDHHEDGQPGPPGFRERLALGDISW